MEKFRKNFKNKLKKTSSVVFIFVHLQCQPPKKREDIFKLFIIYRNMKQIISGIGSTQKPLAVAHSGFFGEFGNVLAGNLTNSDVFNIAVSSNGYSFFIGADEHNKKGGVL